MRFKLQTDYALRALVFMAVNGDRNCTTEEIAEYHEISAAHLGRVIRRLQKLGYVRAIRGRKGGVRLDCDPAALMLGDVVNALEHDAVPLDPQDGDNSTQVDEQSELKAVLRRAHALFVAELVKISLADIASAGLPEKVEVPSSENPTPPQSPRPAPDRPVSPPARPSPRVAKSPLPGLTPAPKSQASRVLPSRPRTLGIKDAQDSRPARNKDQKDGDWVPLGRPLA